MYCSKCGSQIDDAAAFCVHCGAKVGEQQVQPQAQAQPQVQQPVINVINNNTNVNSGFGYVRKNKWVAFFLCLLLGEFGVHRFYVGKVGTGIIWLLTLGLGGIGWLIDLIAILVGGFKDKAGQPLG